MSINVEIIKPSASLRGERNVVVLTAPGLGNEAYFNTSRNTDKIFNSENYPDHFKKGQFVVSASGTVLEIPDNIYLAEE